MEDENNRSPKIYKTLMLIVITAFITFMITSLSLYTYFSKNFAIEDSYGTNISSSTNGIFSKIRSVINKYYLWKDDIDENKLQESAIAGYVEGLGDPYTEFISKDEMKEFTEEITGTFYGIGIYMTADNEKGIIVYYPIPESPAEKAGIKAGDIIKKVDGKEFGYNDFNEIADFIKGQEGSKVKLTIERDGEQMDVEITREKITTNPITTEMLEGNIGYVKVPSFDSETADHFKEKVEALIKDGSKSLIIDLRNNGGGILDESTEIADLFLEKGKTIITTKNNKDKEEITKAKKDQIFNLPIVILSNKNTASASEILIGALKDNGRAKVIGKKTYGKGVIQTVITLSDGSGVKITTAEYYTPSGEAINKVGIKPDIEVELPDKVTNIYAIEKKDDTQLQKAIEELKK